MGIPFVDKLESVADVSTHGDVVLDAFFGFSFQGDVAFL
jgi:hypothetical protein